MRRKQNIVSDNRGDHALQQFIQEMGGVYFDHYHAIPKGVKFIEFCTSALDGVLDGVDDKFDSDETWKKRIERIVSLGPLYKSL